MVDARCRFCGKELRLKIHEAYSTSDPQKLIALAACNPCADIRERRRNLHFRFSSICAGILSLQERASHSMTESERKEVEGLLSKARENIESLNKAYLRLISEWYHCGDIAFEDGMAEAFMNQPMQVSKHIARLWKLAPQQKELLA